MEWHRLREEERGQKGERNLGGYFVELGRATGNSGQIKSPDERNKMNAVLWRSAGKWADCRPECLVLRCAFSGSEWAPEGAHFLGKIRQLTISGLTTGRKSADRARVSRLTCGESDPAKTGGSRRPGAQEKSPGLSTGTFPPPMDTPTKGSPPRRAGRASPVHSSTIVRKCQGRSAAAPLSKSAPGGESTGRDAAGTGTPLPERSSRTRTGAQPQAGGLTLP